MMTPLQEEEETKVSDETDETIIVQPRTPEPTIVRSRTPEPTTSSRPSLFPLSSQERKDSGIFRDVADISSRTHRRPSAFETVFQVLRHPSFEAFGNLRRQSHAHVDLSYRGSPAQQESRSLQGSPVQRPGNRSLVVPPNHVTLRRPSGIITFNPDLMNSHQKRYIMGLLQAGNESSASIQEPQPSSKKKQKLETCKAGNDAFVSLISCFYAKFLFILGIAFPVTEVLSSRVSTHFYQGFYLFLYLGSLGFMSFMYMTFLKDKAITQILKSSFDVEDCEFERIQSKRGKSVSARVERYGSFYLRLGAVAFGIGSMVYSGLEFGQYFELKEDGDCHNLLQAVTPVTRMILTLVQMQFIFLNSKQIEMSRYRSIARFGLMHMMATNLCEWLYVIVEETKHEIIHIVHDTDVGDNKSEKHLHKRGTDSHDIFECRRGNVMGALVQDASPFLFPCTIEYSLICAVICYEMWKTVNNAPTEEEEPLRPDSHIGHHSSKTAGDSQSNNRFSVDCSNAHKGLFSGILILVMTIISLIMFIVMKKDPNLFEIAKEEVHIWELLMYILTTIVVIVGAWQMRFLKFKLKDRLTGLGLDNLLLIWAQSGIYIYCMFSTIACYFMIPLGSPAGMITELLFLLQSTVQTVFILDATFRQTATVEQYQSKPGRQIITFLLVCNMALWLINTLQKSRAEFRPTHSEFYGVWAWTIITHVSMPLAIFFRFHSTICLFEVWKNAYKFKNKECGVQLIGLAAEN